MCKSIHLNEKKYALNWEIKIILWYIRDYKLFERIQSLNLYALLFVHLVKVRKLRLSTLKTSSSILTFILCQFIQQKVKEGSDTITTFD